MYPDVDDEQIIQIYEQSRRNTIWGYGYFVDVEIEYNKAYPVSSGDGLPHDSDDEKYFISRFRDMLIAAGAQVLWYATPRQERLRGSTQEMGWAVILTTGFDKMFTFPWVTTS
ncbi:hypothetical protein BDV93DRAFT_510297 [Ceratobasidium sp. AG-I]|nr:hypothetical protein BDV93DRAFT_510297 [Ceratobasidium sp. AG-I]